MSDAKVDISVSGGEQAATVWEKIARAQQKLLDIDRQRAEDDKKAAQASAEYGRVKARVLAEVETATGRYGQKLNELERVSAAGDMSAEQFSRGLAKITAELQNSNPAVAEAAQRQRELARASQQVLQSIQTPFEGYRQRVAGLKEQLQAGLLTQEQYNRALRQAREELVKGSGKVDERKRKEQELAAQQQQVLQSIITPQERYNRQLQMLSTLRQKNKLDEGQYARAVTHTRQELEKTGETGQSALTGAALGAGKFAMALTGIGSVIGGITVAAQLLRREWENLKERQKGAAERQGDAAAARREMLLNDPDLKPAEADKFVKDTLNETGALPSHIMAAASKAASSRGDLNRDQSNAAVRVAAQINPLSAEAMQGNASALMRFMTLNPKLDAKDAGGFMIAGKQTSPTSTDQQFAENVVPGVTNTMGFGASARESMALHSAIGTTSGDMEGRVTSNAEIKFAKQLAEALPDVKGGPIAQLEALQTEKYAHIKKRFLGALDKERDTVNAGNKNNDPQLEAEAKTFIAEMELIQGGDNRTTQFYRNYYKRLPEIENAAPELKEAMDRINADPVQQNALTKNKLKGQAELLQLDDIAGARGAISREALGELLKNSGVSKFGQDVAQTSFEFASKGGTEAPITALQAELNRQAKTLATDRVWSGGGSAFGDGGDGYFPESAPTTNPERQRVSEALSNIAEGLQPMIDLLSEQNELVKEQTRKAEEAARNAVPPAGGRANTKPLGPRPAAAGQRP